MQPWDQAPQQQQLPVETCCDCKAFYLFESNSAAGRLAAAAALAVEVMLNGLLLSLVFIKKLMCACFHDIFKLLALLSRVCLICGWPAASLLIPVEDIAC